MRWFKAAALFAIVSMVCAVALVAQDSTVVVTPMEEEVGTLITLLTATLSAAVSSVLIGGLKKVQVIVDTAFFKLIAPFTPLFVGLLTALWPFLGNALGIEIPPVDVFMAAPFGTVIAVTAHEVKKKVQQKWPA